MLDSIPAVAAHCKGIFFDDVFSLALYLRSTGRFDLEYQVLQYFMADQTETSEELIKYLHTYLFSSMKNSFEQRQYVKAKWISDQLLMRLILFDAQPLNNLSPHYSRMMKEMYLTVILFRNLGDVYQNPRTVKILMPTGTPLNNSYVLEPNHTMDNSTHLSSVCLYWDGIKAFRNKDYDLADTLFTQTIQGDYSATLNDLAYLMKARCLFWAIDQGQKNLEPSYNARLTDLADSISRINFKNDVYYYIEYLNNPQDAPDAVAALQYPSRQTRPPDDIFVSREDIIDALIEILLENKRAYRGEVSYSPAPQGKKPLSYTVPGPTQYSISPSGAKPTGYKRKKQPDKTVAPNQTPVLIPVQHSANQPNKSEKQ